MGLSDQELAKKMKGRMEKERERQRRWRSRQKDKGLKSVAGMVSQEAFDVIQKEKKRTGEKVSDILERAISNLENQVDDNTTSNVADDVINNDTHPPEDAQISLNEEDIINRVNEMRANENLPFNEIAKRFNNEGLATLSGDGNWDGKTIYNILKAKKEAAG